MAGANIYIIGVVPVKLSLIFLYNRIFPNTRLRVLLWAVAIIVSGWGVAGTFVAIFRCVPFRANWDPFVEARCVSFKAVAYSQGVQSILTDLILLCAPMPLIWGLQMPLAKKVQICGIFMTGGL